MRDKLTDTELNDAINRPQVCWVPSDIEVARRGLRELQSHRAADDPEDAEYASYEASKAQDAQLAAMTAGQLERLGSGVMFELMRRAADKAEAAWDAAPVIRIPGKEVGTIHGKFVPAEREQAAPQAEPTRADALNYAWLASRWRKLSETGAEVGVDLGMQAEREQAAPEEPRKLAKWERRLAKMSGSLRYEPDLNGRGVWVCTFPGVVFDTDGSMGLTPQAAVAASWRAWKAARS